MIEPPVTTEDEVVRELPGPVADPARDRTW